MFYPVQYMPCFVVSQKGTNRNDEICPAKLPNLPCCQNFQDDLLERVPYLPNRGGGPVFGVECPSRVGPDKWAKGLLYTYVGRYLGGLGT